MKRTIFIKILLSTLMVFISAVFQQLEAAETDSLKVTISGYVHDADQQPLELVSVHIKNTLNGVVTNEKGFYKISLIPKDSVTLVFSCLGYNTAERIIPSLKTDARLSVQMNYKSWELEGITVTATRKQLNTMERLEADKVKFVPDPSGGSIESLVVTFAGVSQSNELSAQYSVRGGSYDENMVYVNGMEIYRPLLIRSGQQEGLSFVNPDMTESVQFAAGGFGAEFGDKMASVLDIHYKRPKKNEGAFSLGLMGGNAHFGSSHGKFTQISAIRVKSGKILMNTMDTNAEYSPIFGDAQTFMSYQINPKFELSFLGNISMNRYKFIPKNRQTSFGTLSNSKNFEVFFQGQERDRFDTGFASLQAEYKPSEKLTLGIRGNRSISKELETYDIAGEFFLNEAGQESVATEETEALGVGAYKEHARNRLNFQVNQLSHYGLLDLKGHKLSWSLSWKDEQISDHISEWEKRDSVGYSLPYNGKKVSVYSNLYFDHKLTSSRYSGYITDKIKFRSPQGLFTVAPGLRLAYWDYTKEWIFSPRISVAFSPNNLSNAVFRFAAGVYQQAPFYKELRSFISDEQDNRTILLNSKLKSQKAYHFILGGDYAFKLMDRNFKLTTEIYYKLLNDINPYTLDNVKVRYYGANVAKGYIAGLDMKLFGEFVSGTDSWLTVSLIKTQQTINETIKAPLPNEQQYNISLYFQDYFPGNDRFQLTLKGVLSGGLPVTPPNSGWENGYFRTPSYKRVDIGTSYLLFSKEQNLYRNGIWKNIRNIWLGVDIFNLFGIRNTASYYWVTDSKNNKYAVPNYLTNRQVNARLLIEF